jgi:hypothetical protein
LKSFGIKRVRLAEGCITHAELYSTGWQCKRAVRRGVRIT